MISGNVAEPNALLEKYQQFEYIFNTDKKVLIDKLFKGGPDSGKAPLDDIKEQIQHFE